MKPLCVDLDGTLVNTDTLWESYLLLLKQNPLLALFALTKIFHGKAFFKDYLANKTELDVTTLPYNQPLLKWLKHEKQTGRCLILVTASNQRIAERVAKHIELFDDVIGSDVSNSMQASNKHELLIQKFGDKQFDYAGNHKKDLTVWQHSQQSIVVNASAKVTTQAQQLGNVEKIFKPQRLNLKTFLKTIRVHQYVKNLLLFVPFLLGFSAYDLQHFFDCVLGFLAFSALASSVYVLNDLLDLKADRLHPRKQLRGFAAGLLSIPTGFLLIIGFLTLSITLMTQLSWSFALVLIVYYVLTISYSFFLKQKILVDAIVLAGLYTLRVIAGMKIIGSGYYEWIIMFSMFIFLSLAFLKRYTELNVLLSDKRMYSSGRGYHVKNVEVVRTFGITSGYIAALIVALYLNSNKAVTTYHHPQFLWLISVVIVYWISRLWILASEGKVHDDPVVFAIKDKVSYLLVVAVAILVGLAVLPLNFGMI